MSNVAEDPLHQAGQLLQDLRRRYAVANEELVGSKTQTMVESWIDSTDAAMKRNNPHYRSLQLLDIAEQQVDQGVATLDAVASDIQAYMLLAHQLEASTFLETFWQDRIQALEKRSKRQSSEELAIWNSEVLALRSQVLSTWRQLVETASIEWRQQFLRQEREKFYTSLDEWLSALSQIDYGLQDARSQLGDLYNDFTLPVTAAGLAQIQAWFSYIESQPGIKELCREIGRTLMSTPATEDDAEDKAIELVDTPKVTFDIASAGEINAIRAGNDIAHLIPTELALLANPETQVLFDSKFFERSLYSFQMQEEIFHNEQIEVLQDVKFEEVREMGPMILCVDTSGSMRGGPESIAKAVTLYLATMALAEDRPCFVITFSNAISTIDVTAEGIAGLDGFLQHQFNRGTDVSMALNAALDQHEQEDYARADFLIISDLEMGRVDYKTLGKIRKAKESDNHVLSLAIGDGRITEDLDRLFNHRWFYDIGGNEVKSLTEADNPVQAAPPAGPHWR